MKVPGDHMLSKIDRQKLWRSTVMLACPIAILWLGGDAIDHVSEMYNGLCPVQGSGLAVLIYDGNPLAYCAGIGQSLSMLGLIMGIAALAVPSAVGLWWSRP